MKKVKFISIVVCLLAVLLVVGTADAELFNRGTDSLGNRLIYDDDPVPVIRKIKKRNQSQR